MKFTSMATTILACVGLTACSSVSGQIAKLNDEDRDLVAKISTLQDERKSVERLITALQQYQRSSDARNAEALAKARALYETCRR